MNSVFSAFSKSGGAGKSDSSSGGGASSGINNSASNSSKLLNPKKTPPRTPTDPTSYESLRHIREIAYGTNMSNFIATNGDDEEVATPTPSPLSEKNSVDILGLDFSEHDVVDCAPAAAIELVGNVEADDADDDDENQPKCSSGSSSSGSECGGGVGGAENSSFLANVKSSTATTLLSSPVVSRDGYGSRFHKPRLSLSNSTGLCSTGMPAVHKRSNNNGAMNGNAPPTRTRLSTHQRNLSLDFR